MLVYYVMKTEKDILLNMHQIIYEFIVWLNNTKTQVSNINKNVELVNNNYFIEDKDNVYMKFSDIFNFNDINILEQNLQNLSDIITDKIDNSCQHEWIDDDIEIDAEMSQKIWYCKYCGTSKKV